jgi:hypothetical protein
MAINQALDLKTLDNAIFGRQVIIMQSSSDMEETSMFNENSATQHRKLKKAKPYYKTSLQGRTDYQISRSSVSKIQEDDNRTTYDIEDKNGFGLNYGEKSEYISVRNCRSEERPTTGKQREASNCYSEYTSNLSTLPSFANEEHDFHHSLSQIISRSPSAEIDDLPIWNRHLPLSNRKANSFHGASLHYCECSHEKQNGGSGYSSDSIEVDNDSLTHSCQLSTDNYCVDNDNSAYIHNIHHSLSQIFSRSPSAEIEDLPIWNRYVPLSSRQSVSFYGASLYECKCSIEEQDEAAYNSEFSDVDIDVSAQSCASAKEKNEVDNGSSRAKSEEDSRPGVSQLVDDLLSDIYGNSRGKEFKSSFNPSGHSADRSDLKLDHCSRTEVSMPWEGQTLHSAKNRNALLPYPGDDGFTQWVATMQTTAQLPDGIPPEFRRRLWLSLAEKYLESRRVDWSDAEKLCFNDRSNPGDDKLEVQTVKDLQRTDCPVFFGTATKEKEKLLKRVLLAYARWNSVVGYCNGFNMLAAVILNVMDFSEGDALKVMIHLIEGVLPDNYFAKNLHGLSVEMRVLGDLLKLRLPKLSQHLEQLQNVRRRESDACYEPPLINVLTRQWFLTLFCNCLSQSAVRRVWDLLFLEGNVVLQRTALAILDELAGRIMAEDRSDKFYSIIEVLTSKTQLGLMDANYLINKIVKMEPLQFPQLSQLREKYMYNITPWKDTASMPTNLVYQDDDDDDYDDDREHKNSAKSLTAYFRSQKQYSLVSTKPPSSISSATNYSPASPDKYSLTVDMLALQQKYTKTQKQHRKSQVPVTRARSRQLLKQIVPTSAVMTHLQLESELHSAR